MEKNVETMILQNIMVYNLGLKALIWVEGFSVSGFRQFRA